METGEELTSRQREVRRRLDQFYGVAAVEAAEPQSEDPTTTEFDAENSE